MQSLKNLASNTQKYRRVYSYNTIKLNAAFCCTTVQDVDVLTGWVSMQQAAVVHFQSYRTWSLNQYAFLIPM